MLESQRLNKNVASQIVPLVTKMRRLKTLHVGVKDRYTTWTPPNDNMDMATLLRTDPNRFYDSMSCGAEFGSVAADLPFFKRLVEEFIASFESNELSRNLDFKVLEGMGQKCCGGSLKRGCTLCRRILEHFPLDEHLLFLRCCYSLRKKIPIILSRPGGKELLRSKAVMQRFLRRYRTLWRLEDHLPFELLDEDEYYPPAYDGSAIAFVQKDLDLFESLTRQNIGFDPSILTREEVQRALGCWDSRGETDVVVFLLRSTYTRLDDIGFQLDILPGSIREWQEDIDFRSGIYVQPDDTFERDTEDERHLRHCPLEYQEDSSDDEEDFDRKERAWSKKIGLPYIDTA